MFILEKREVVDKCFEISLNRIDYIESNMQGERCKRITLQNVLFEPGIIERLCVDGHNGINGKELWLHL